VLQRFWRIVFKAIELSALLALYLECGNKSGEESNQRPQNIRVDSAATERNEKAQKPTEKSKWVLRNPLPTGMNLYSVAFGNGRFVAVGGIYGFRGVFLISTDGVSWSKRETDTSFFANKIIFGNEKFVAMDAVGKFLISSDGENWIQRIIEVPNHLHLNQLCFGDSLFVAVGDSGFVFTSGDGETWHEQKRLSSRPLLDIAYGNNKFVAVGGRIFQSSDGIMWAEEQSSKDPEEEKSLFAIAFNNGLFVALTNDPMSFFYR
jgi:photosystem II stability/assembly factor-like uncharacterized protein